MATFRLLTYAEMTGLTDGRVQRAGDKSVFTEFTPTNGEFFQAGAVVADAATEVVMWNTTEGGLATYEHGIIETDKDITIQLSDGAVDTLFSLKAGMKASFGGQILGTMGGSSTTDTMGNVDSIIVKRNVANGVGDAFVTLTLVG